MMAALLNAAEFARQIQAPGSAAEIEKQKQVRKQRRSR